MRVSETKSAISIQSPAGGNTLTARATKGSGVDAFDVTVFAASCDKPELNKAFAEELKLDYPILSDPGGKVAAEFGVLNKSRGFSNRWTYYFGKNGKLLFVDKNVNARAHGADVVAKLKELGIAKKGG